MDSIVSITKNNRHQAKVKQRPSSVDASHVLISCLRAILARGIFIVHSIVTIRQTVLISER